VYSVGNTQSDNGFGKFLEPLLVVLSCFYWVKVLLRVFYLQKM
jgi:hypothetical protein